MRITDKKEGFNKLSRNIKYDDVYQTQPIKNN